MHILTHLFHYTETADQSQSYIGFVYIIPCFGQRYNGQRWIQHHTLVPGRDIHRHSRIDPEFQILIAKLVTYGQRDIKTAVPVTHGIIPETYCL